MKNQFFSFIAIAFIFCGCKCIPIYGPPDMNSYRKVALESVNVLITHSSIYDFPLNNEGRKPRIGIGRIRNKTGDGGEYQPIDVEQVSLRIREALINSRQVEIYDQAGLDPHPADYYLEGEIKASWIDRVVNGKPIRERQYSFMLWISSIEKSNIVWQNTADVPGILLNPCN